MLNYNVFNMKILYNNTVLNIDVQYSIIITTCKVRVYILLCTYFRRSEILFFWRRHGRKKNFIDSLGRWFDDSRMADRNRRLPTNDSREFCSNRVVNITSPTFILSAKFRINIVTER